MPVTKTWRKMFKKFERRKIRQNKLPVDSDYKGSLRRLLIERA